MPMKQQNWITDIWKYQFRNLAISSNIFALRIYLLMDIRPKIFLGKLIQIIVRFLSLMFLFIGMKIVKFYYSINQPLATTYVTCGMKSSRVIFTD